VPGSREKITIATKGTIGGGMYNASEENLLKCIELASPAWESSISIYTSASSRSLYASTRTARVLNSALKSGKICAIGVSNYYPEQVRALQTYLDSPIVSNQIEISLARLDPIYEGLEAAEPWRERV
jgi:predicted oxidoreductase